MGSNSNDWVSEHLPTDDGSQHVWQIVRAPADRPLTLCLVSNDWYGVRVHYYQNRTMPCLSAGCVACDHKLATRWKGYCLAVENGTGRKLIFEFPAGVVSLFADVVKSETSLRGLVCIVTRTSKKVNGRVHVTFKGATKNRAALPEETEIKALLERIWGYTANPGHIYSAPTDFDLGADAHGRQHYPVPAHLPEPPDVHTYDLPGQMSFIEARQTAADLGSVLRSPDAA